MNVNRTGAKIYPFVTKDGTKNSFKTVSTNDYNQFALGDVLSGTYELTSSITTDYYSLGSDRLKINALKNTLNYYYKIRLHYVLFPFV